MNWIYFCLMTLVLGQPSESITQKEGTGGPEGIVWINLTRWLILFATIMGVLIGVLLVIIVCVYLVFFLSRRKQNGSNLETSKPVTDSV